MKKSVGSAFPSGAVYIEVTAESAEAAVAVVRAIEGLTVNEDFSPVQMAGGTWILSGQAGAIVELPAGVVLWTKAEHQMTGR